MVFAAETISILSQIKRILLSSVPRGFLSM